MTTQMQKRDPRAGSYLVLFTLVATALFGLAGMATDLIWAYVVKARLVSATEAAVLAAIEHAPSSSYIAVADDVFNANFRSDWPLAVSRSHAQPVVSSDGNGDVSLRMTATAETPTTFMRVFGYRKLVANATSRAFRPVKPSLLLCDEDCLDNGSPEVDVLANVWGCGNGDPAKCVNDDISNIGLRHPLFTRPNNVLPLSGITLPTGQTGDEGLFRFTRDDPQVSNQNGATFTLQEFLAASGAAADENNLDKVAGVQALGSAAILNLVDVEFCLVAFDSDVSADPSTGEASLKGDTLGVAAGKVTGTTGGGDLPRIVVNLYDKTKRDQVCQAAVGDGYPPYLSQNNGP